LDPKPIKWDYYQNADRTALYDVYSKLIKLRTHPNYASTFITGVIKDSLNNAIKSESVSGDSLKVIVLGNFDVETRSATVFFPTTGTWYSYLTDSTTNLASTSVHVTLQPGEYYVFTNKNVKDIVLPVNWLNFTAQRTTARAVELKWSTATELNNDHYEIQRSVDGVSFSTIASVIASNKRQYEYTDTHPFVSTNFYRIKQVDKDGKYSYSFIVKISINDNGIRWQLYPNPAENNTAIYAQKDLIKVRVILTDLSGRILFLGQYNNISVGEHIDIPVQNLAKGVYMLKVISEQGSKTEKLVVN
jgi:hypothetical protein